MLEEQANTNKEPSSTDKAPRKEKKIICFRVVLV